MDDVETGLDAKRRALLIWPAAAGALFLLTRRADDDAALKVQEVMLEPAKAMPILAYCGDGSSLGPRGTQALNAAGFVHAVNLKPGIAGWANAGLPIESGAGRHA